ncbi:MAG: hypothetical protein ACRD0S_13725 [Acidimicrobiales bacterium]
MGDKLTDTDMNPEPVKGVGESTNRRGEEVIEEEGAEPGRQPNKGTKGAGRPYGTSDARDATSIDPQESVTGNTMNPGDQGG